MNINNAISTAHMQYITIVRLVNFSQPKPGKFAAQLRQKTPNLRRIRGRNYSHRAESIPSFRCRLKTKHLFRFNAIFDDCMKISGIIMTTESLLL